MNMQAMIAQAQKMQRELKKAQDALKEKEFTITKSGIVTLVMTGDKKIKSISIDPEAIDVENKEMIEEAISLAFNELLALIEKESDAISQKVTGQAGGFGF